MRQSLPGRGAVAVLVGLVMLAGVGVQASPEDQKAEEKKPADAQAAPKAPAPAPAQAKAAAPAGATKAKDGQDPATCKPKFNTLEDVYGVTRLPEAPAVASASTPVVEWKVAPAVDPKVDPKAEPEKKAPPEPKKD